MIIRHTNLKTQRGNDVFCHDNIHYTLNKETITELYYVCQNRNCKSHFNVSLIDTSMFTITKEHHIDLCKPISDEKYRYLLSKLLLFFINFLIILLLVYW